MKFQYVIIHRPLEVVFKLVLVRSTLYSALFPVVVILTGKVKYCNYLEEHIFI